jgi:hypothetical protein
LASAAGARIWHVPADAATIQAGIDSSSSGDEVVVACDTYYEHDLMLKSGIVLRAASSSSDCVTIDAQQSGSVIICQDVDNTTVIEGFVLQHGAVLGPFPDNAGGGIYCSNSSPTIRHCVLRENGAQYGGGLYCRDSSSPVLEDCRIVDNTSQISGGGVHCFNSSSPALTSCIVSGNLAGVGGGGLYASSLSTPMLANCTFFGNSASDGAALACWDLSAPTLSNVLIAFNRDGEGILYRTGSDPALTCCNMFGNDGGDWIGDLSFQLGVNGNIGADPQFCSSVPHLHQNWTLQSDSPCTPAQSACGLIGALGVGCASVGVRQETWGAVKSLYR